jgi:hypothetical protein
MYHHWIMTKTNNNCLNHMQRSFSFLSGGAIILISSLLFHACVHDPVINDDDTFLGEGPSSDTVVFEINTKTCEEDIIYFENQVLPIFISNCAISGCHDIASAEEEVILTDYSNIIKGIDRGNPEESEYFKVLVEDKADELMPRKPDSEEGFKLSDENIATVKSWILQGAQNNYCNECDTTYISFANRVSVIIDQNCATSVACHGEGSTNAEFTDYIGVKKAAENGLIEQRAIIFKTMPPSGQLPDCDMLVLKKWLDAGAQNN